MLPTISKIRVVYAFLWIRKYFYYFPQIHSVEICAYDGGYRSPADFVINFLQLRRKLRMEIVFMLQIIYYFGYFITHYFDFVLNNSIFFL